MHKLTLRILDVILDHLNAVLFPGQPRRTRMISDPSAIARFDYARHCERNRTTDLYD